VATIYTIEHSTRTFDELVATLKAYGIRMLVDIRSFPMSRRLPHFNRESLEVELPKHGIAYIWMKEMGGRRRKIRNDSPNTGLRNESFRNYADYMLTEEFGKGIERLLMVAQQTAGPLRQAQGRLLTAIGRQGDLSPLGVANVESGGNTAIMCAERVYFQCHRMVVSDYLTVHGHSVVHIEDERRPPREHKLMAEARLVDGRLVYDSQLLF
jgi:uncharacterized protein (DUF488 family)